MLICGALAAFTIVPAGIVVGQESLAAARELYSSAAYDEALALLGRLRGSDYSHDENRSIDVYRALCLMALGRSAEAVRAIDSIVTEYPTYRPSASDLPPRVRTAFSDARRRLLPAIIQQKYTQAKAAWDRREYVAAKTGFGDILDALADPDMAALANQPPLSDLRTLAVGFHDLSVKATAPPPAPRPVPAAAPAIVAPPAPRPANRVFSAEDVNVAMPLVLQQSLPPFPGQTLVAVRGAVEVVIDETGAVESATMRMSVSTQYDKLVLAAANAWRYQPASMGGTPVKFRKIIMIAVPASR